MDRMVTRIKTAAVAGEIAIHVHYAGHKSMYTVYVWLCFCALLHVI